MHVNKNFGLALFLMLAFTAPFASAQAKQANVSTTNTDSCVAGPAVGNGTPPLTPSKDAGGQPSPERQPTESAPEISLEYFGIGARLTNGYAIFLPDVKDGQDLVKQWLRAHDALMKAKVGRQEDDALTVSRIYYHHCPERLLVGDRIVAVNGQSLIGMRRSQAIVLLRRGLLSETVKLSVLRRNRQSARKKEEYLSVDLILKRVKVTVQGHELGCPISRDEESPTRTMMLDFSRWKKDIVYFGGCSI